MAREKRELSQAELADRSGLQASAISHFEIGTRQPSVANLSRLADALEVSTDYLLGRSDDVACSARTDVLFRTYADLAEHDREVLRDLAAQMAKRAKKESKRKK